MTIKCYARDFKVNGCTRGNSLDTIKPHKRNMPCVLPLKAIYIDYNGSVMPCCNLRSDIKEHERFIMGNVNDNTLEEIFNNQRYMELRKQVFKWRIKLMPCRECNFPMSFN